MLKISLVILILCSSISLIIALSGIANAQDRKSSINWQPIIGSKFFSGKLFIDGNSLRTVEGENGRYNLAEILVSYDYDTDVIVGKEKYAVKSIVKSVVIECGTGLMAPILDLYFTHPKPLRATKPISGLDYPSNVSSTAVVLKKNTSLYHALCPKYI
jgi:hypothetical protein